MVLFSNHLFSVMIIFVSFSLCMELVNEIILLSILSKLKTVFIEKIIIYDKWFESFLRNILKKISILEKIISTQAFNYSKNNIDLLKYELCLALNIYLVICLIEDFINYKIIKSIACYKGEIRAIITKTFKLCSSILFLENAIC